MVAARHDAGRQVDAPGKDPAAHLAEAFPHPVVVAHLSGAVIHVEHGTRGQLAAAHQRRQRLRSHPQRGRERRRTAKHIAVLQKSVQAHEAAHGAAADEGMSPVGLCAVVGVDVGLELVDEPVQGVLAFAVEVAVLLIVEAVGRILHQTLIVGTGVALHRRHDEGRIGVVQIIRHAPALTVGGVLVEKHVLPVEHIQHRIPPVRVSLVHGGQIDIGPALFFAAHSGVADAPLLYHLFIPSRFSGVL